MVIVYPEEEAGTTGIAESIEKPRSNNRIPLMTPILDEIPQRRRTKRIKMPRSRQIKRSSPPGGLAQFRVPSQPVPDMPQENWHQNAFHQMFGGGDQIWGWKNEPVELNETITSGDGLIKGTEKLSDKDSERRTAQMFGF